MKALLNLPVSILKEGKRYVAYTPALDLSTSGKNYQEVKNRFEEAVGVFFEELVTMGTVEPVLTGLGWQKMHREWLPPMVISNESEPIRVSVS